MLESQVTKLCVSEESHRGIICYSVGMLPPVKLTNDLISRILDNGKSMHFFLENISVSTRADLCSLIELLVFQRNFMSTYDY